MSPAAAGPPDGETGRATPLRPEELDRLLALDPLTRAEWMLEDCARNEEAWGLVDADGWVLHRLDEGPEGRSPWALPLWPRPELAALAARDAGERTKRLDLAELLDALLPDMERRNWQVQSFPSRDGGLVEGAADFGRRLEEAWNEWSDEDG